MKKFPFDDRNFKLMFSYNEKETGDSIEIESHGSIGTYGVYDAINLRNWLNEVIQIMEYGRKENNKPDGKI